jgi:hypothetical protein
MAPIQVADSVAYTYDQGDRAEVWYLEALAGVQLAEHIGEHTNDTSFVLDAGTCLQTWHMHKRMALWPMCVVQCTEVEQVDAKG